MLPTIAVLAVVSALSASPVKLEVRPDTRAEGAYSVLLDGVEWLPAGKPVEFWHHGTRLSAAGGGLTAEHASTTHGADSLGDFARHATVWRARTSPPMRFVTAVRVYAHAAVFEQQYPDGASPVEPGAGQPLASTFPSFLVRAEPSSAGPGRRGFLQYIGEMIGSHYRAGEWTAAAAARGALGPGGLSGTGPLVLFAESLASSAVLSPLASAMATSQHVDATAEPGPTLGYGLHGNVTHVPAGFRLETIVVASGGGVRAAMLAWGDALLARTGKARSHAWASDLTLQYLGYSTDAGSYYYYRTAPGASYEQTIVGLAEYARAARLPFAYWLADSWWYYKEHPGGGVTNWTARPEVFPSGLASVYARTGLAVQAHNRFWSAKTNYTRDFKFVVAEPTPERAHPLALPVERRFWDWLMRGAAAWGMRVYEQDWLDAQHRNFPPLLQSATLGHEWLGQMADAAAAAGVSIQYCMSYPRHVLASAALPAVTQVRASEDYHAGSNQWAPVGTTALFAYALGLAPSKDNFWSSPAQPRAPKAREPHSRLQAAVSTLSKGPVQPSDAIGHADRELIMRSAMEDGRLLQPAAPAMKVDCAILASALGARCPDADGGCSCADPSGTRPRGELWSAETEIDGRVFGVVFGAQIAADLELTPALAGLDGASRAEQARALGYVAVEANASSRALPFSASEPLRMRACGKADFQLWNVAPREPNGWALLGEVRTKWVGVSSARFSAISSDEETVVTHMRGTPGERIIVGFVPPPRASSPRQDAGGEDQGAAQTVVFVESVVSEAGTAVAQAPPPS